MDPGSSCYIAIGLARKDYPRNRHPGWNKGSIAYHADDGKVFMGSGVGDPFGPRCNKGDIMGCGVLFPKDFESRSDSEEEGELMARIVEDHLQEAEEYETDSGDEEDWWRPDLKLGDKVQVMIKILISSKNINKIFSRFTSRGTGRSSGRRRWCCPRAVSTPQSA